MKQLVHFYFKTSFLLIFIITFATQLQAQVKIGENPESINPFSLLELESTDKAFLFPRLSSSQRDAAFDRDKAPLGLTIFNTTTNQLEVLHRDFSPTARERTRWTPLGTASVPTGAAAPTTAANGALFFDTTNDQFMVYDGKEWHSLQTFLGDRDNLQVLTLSEDGKLQLGTSTVDLQAWLEKQNSSGSDNQQLSYTGTVLSLENGGSVDMSNLISPPQLLQLGATTSTTTRLDLTNGGSISLQASGTLSFDTQNGRLVIEVPPVQEGPFSTTNSITSNATNGYANEDFVIGSSQLDNQTGPDDNNRLFFEKNTGAFRAGYDGSSVWNAANRGDASVGLGYNTKAEGDRSVALGNSTQAEAFSEIALGSYNTLATSPNPTAWTPTDRLLTVGNGTSALRNNALTILKNGNTGLGIDTPTATLHVSGTLRFVDGSQGNGRVLTSDANGNATWQAGSASTDSQTINFGAATGIVTATTLAISDGNTLSLQASGGLTFNQTDSATLELIATTGGGDNIYSTDGTLGGNRVITQNNNALSFTASGTNAFSIDGSSFSVDASNNRIGIGTNSPQETLHVSGTLRLTDGTQQGGLVLTSDPLGNASWQPVSVAVSSTIDSQTLSFEDPATATVTRTSLQISGGNALTLQASGGLTFNQTDSTTLEFVFPAASSGGTNIYTADGTLNSNRVVTQAANSLKFDATGVDAFAVDGSTFSVDAANNRVGLGTTAPTATLDVVGNILVGTARAGAQWPTTPDNGATFLTPTIQTRSSPASIETAIRLIQPSSTVLGTAKWHPIVDLLVGSYQSGISPSSELRFRLNHTEDDASEADIMTLRSNGNVGIGTVIPTQTLHVQGNARITGTPAAAGATTDRVVTVDTNGNLRSIAQANLSNTNTDSQTLSFGTATATATTLALVGGNTLSLQASGGLTFNQTDSTTLELIAAGGADNDWVANTASSTWDLRFRSDGTTPRSDNVFSIGDDGALAVGARAQAGSEAIALGNDARATGTFSAISGGDNNVASGWAATISGGVSNTATGSWATVGGGNTNNATAASYATIAGGGFNSANGSYSFIGGGNNNTASGQNSTVSGGRNNSATGAWSAIGGGNNNTASGQNSIVSGGSGNSATGDFSVASGRGNFAAAYGEWVGGLYATTRPVSAISVQATDRIFAVGNGQGNIQRSNALEIYRNGNTGINLGTASPTATLQVSGTVAFTGQTSLAVAGDVRITGNYWVGTQSLTVPDYVFESYFDGTSKFNPNYRMLSLAEVEAFVKINKHLPGVRSQQVVHAEGQWNIVENTRINLEKIEELYLHTISQEKEINALKEQLKQQGELIEKLLKEMKN